jgi:hypothetical protein
LLQYPWLKAESVEAAGNYYLPLIRGDYVDHTSGRSFASPMRRYDCLVNLAIRLRLEAQSALAQLPMPHRHRFISGRARHSQPEQLTPWQSCDEEDKSRRAGLFSARSRTTLEHYFAQVSG